MCFKEIVLGFFFLPKIWNQCVPPGRCALLSRGSVGLDSVLPDRLCGSKKEMQDFLNLAAH